MTHMSKRFSSSCFQSFPGLAIAVRARHPIPAQALTDSRARSSRGFSRVARDIRHWRMERRIRIGYDDREYARPELQWTQSSFIQPQMMIHDRYFYDPAAGKYTVDRYLDDLEQRYGGIDSVLIWQTYPNIGHRQPQPVRPVARHAGRHRRACGR